MTRKYSVALNRVGLLCVVCLTSMSLLFAACKQPSSPDPTPPASPGTEQEPSDPTSETPSGSDTKPETPSGSDTKPETPSGSDTEPETPSGSDTKPETPSGSDTEPETPSGSDTKPETPSGSDTEPETPSGSDTEPETPPGSDTEPETPSGSDTKPETPPGSDTKPETPSGSDTKPEEPDTSLQEFNDVASLSEWLNAQVQNTAEHPYRIKVKNIDLTNKSNSKSGNTLRTLYSALSRYVALDLSESTGESIFNVSAETVPNKANVVSIILPETVTSVLLNAFIGCTNLTSITMPKVTSIAKSAFKGLEQLKSVSMPEIVTLEDGDSSSTGVFYGCTALVSIMMPKIESIGDFAFRKCSALESITLGSTPPTLGNTVLTGADAFKAFYVSSNALQTYRNTSQVGWDEGIKNKVVAIAK